MRPARSPSCKSRRASPASCWSLSAPTACCKPSPPPFRTGGSTIDIPVSDQWGAGAYVTATLFRPGDAQELRMPARAIGLKWLTIDPGARKLAVALSPVAKI